MNVMKMRMYRRRCHVCGKVCNTTTLAAICARCRNIKRDTKMICGDAFSREHNNDVAEPSNVEPTSKEPATVERKTHPPLVSSDLLDGESESFRKCLLCDCIALDFSVLCSGCQDDWDAIP